MLKMHYNYCKKEILKLLQKAVKDKIIPGYSCAFIHNSQIETYYGGVQGCIPPYNDVLIKEGMIYDLASVTKVVATTTRILQMMENKQIAKNTKVQEILPEYRDNATTIEELLFHTSGLVADIYNKEDLTPLNIRTKIYEQIPNQKKKNHVEYSDIGYILLGFIIEKIDGSLEMSCQDNIFIPLNMMDTSWKKVKESKRYIPTEITQKRGCICKETHDTKAFLLKESGSAGLFSTLDDLIKFCVAILNQDEILLKKETYEKLEQDTVQKRTWGWQKPYGNHILYHTGFTGTSILLDIKEKYGLILLTNRIHPNRDNQEFLKVRIRINEIFRENTK